MCKDEWTVWTGKDGMIAEILVGANATAGISGRGHGPSLKGAKRGRMKGWRSTERRSMVKRSVRAKSV